MYSNVMMFPTFHTKRSPVKHQTCLRANIHFKPWAKFPCYWHSGFKMHKVQFLHLFCDNQAFYLPGFFPRTPKTKEKSSIWKFHYLCFLMPVLGLTFPISKRSTPVREKIQWKDWQKVILNNNYNKLNLSIWVNVLWTLALPWAVWWRIFIEN